MLADSLTKTGYPARAVMESFLVKKRWRCTFDPTIESGRRRKARGAPLFNQEDFDEINSDSRVFHVDSVFLRLCFVSGLGASNVTLGWQFLTRTHVFLVTVRCSPGSRGDSRVLGIVAVWSTVALSISVFLLSTFYSALSQSVFLERYRED